MEIVKLYIELNKCQIDLENNQKQKNVQNKQCNDYFDCVQNNSHLIERYERLLHEISRDFVHQRFDVNTLSHNFERLEIIDSKIRDLQNSMSEIRKFMKSESSDIESTMRQFFNDLYFDQMDEAEEWIDSVFLELARRKQERVENLEQFKSAGRAVASFLWKTISK